ncbi:hypothetical protein D3C72_2304880 [compost metagenome]
MAFGKAWRRITPSWPAPLACAVRMNCLPMTSSVAVRAKRAMRPASGKASVTAGMIRCSGVDEPEDGRMRKCRAKTRISRMPRKKIGME